jgi:hypothetical protein
MAKITLTDLADLQNELTAVSAINNNNNTIETAFDNTLSRDGTLPNTMGANIDMNSNRLLNLPAPQNGSEPARLQDLATITGGGTISVPTLTAGTNISLTGTSNITVATTANPTFSTSVTTPQVKNVTGSVLIPVSGTVTIPAATDTVVVRNSADTLTNKTLTAPVISTITNGGTLTLPTGPETLVGRATADTLTNKTFNTASNTFTINGVGVSRGQYVGTNTNDNATAGNIGEFASNTASSVSFSSGVAFNVTSVSLTAGDWDVWGQFTLGNSGATTYTSMTYSLSSISATHGLSCGENVNIAGASYTKPVLQIRFSLSATTTVFLVVSASFTGGTPTAGGNIFARRAR